ncbi:MAG: hypothetical protein ACI4RN_08585 [Oscillospiraceae bacterium]
MKKIKALTSALVCMIIMFTITGCGKKTALSAEDFKSKTEAKGYTVQDATNQFADYDYIKKVYIALDKDQNYQIEFYEIDNADNASQFFKNNKSIFEESKSSASAETSVSVSNNAKYTLTTDGQYKVISRIDNTAVYVNADEEYKSDIKDLLDDLDY